MSLRNTIRSFPTLLLIGVSEAVAYRAELLIWILATTMPLVMMALWSTVARDAPVGRFNQQGFVVYFLSAFIVRQLTGNWTAWQMNFDVRQGTLAMRLLRPVHPIATYAAEILAAVPLRILVALPVAAIMLVTGGKGLLPRDPAIWALWLVSVGFAWLIAFFINCAIGALSFFLESSLKVMDAYLALWFVFSGYTIPVELFPEGLRRVADFLPFRYAMGLPIELMTGAHDRAHALGLVAVQALYALGAGLLAFGLWSRGTRRFAAYGG